MAPDDTDLGAYQYTHPDENTGATPEHDDLSLENAIGDAFKQFAFLEEHKDEDKGDDLDLEAVVGNALMGLTDEVEGGKKDDVPDMSDDQLHKDMVEEMGDELNLEAAVGDAFRMLAGDDGKGEESGKHNEDVIEILHVENKEEETDDKIDLEAAIGDAFKSITVELGLDGVPQAAENHTSFEQTETTNISQHTSTEERHEVPSPQQIPGISNHALSHSASHSHSPEALHQEDDSFGDENLEDAIGEAFKSLTGSFQPESPKASKEKDDVLHAAISASFQEIMGRDDKLEVEIEQPVHVAENDTEDSISQDVLQELAKEITDQVEGEDKKEIPQLDDNVLAHFQMEANQSDKDDSVLKSALATAVRSAIQQAPREQGSKEELDLESLQMNEILQNAFNMAMLNPQELLTSLEMEEEGVPDRSAEKDLSALSTAAAIAALSVKEALSKRDESKGSDQKSLSIAETLALHRSAMSAPKRDYSLIQSLQESVGTDSLRAPALNPQLSNILSSLSHHIQSGDQSQNLMLVIRQMTNALMLNKSSPYTVSAVVQELLTRLKGNPEEQQYFVESLQKTKHYLEFEFTDIKDRASVLVENALSLFENNQIDPHITGISSAGHAPEVINEYFTHVFSILSNYAASKLRIGLAGMKTDADSLEREERIRTENRERKKKWREDNIERNKDNDLRSRVIKRAASIFGESNGLEKKAWIEEEFNKRREKRLAKIKKESDKSDGRLPETLGDLKSGVLSHDPKFERRLTDFFNLMTNSGTEQDLDVLLTTVSAVIAVVASSHAASAEIDEVKTVQSAISLILNSVLDSAIKSGGIYKIPFLLKKTSGEGNIHSIEKEDSLSRLSSLAASLQGSTSALDVLRESQKRLGYDFLSSDSKKPKLDEAGQFLERDKTSMSRIQSHIDQLRSSITSSTSGHLLGSTTGLKMPLYKRPSVSASLDGAKDEDSKQQIPIPIPTIASPFISNKIGLTENPAPMSGGLKKPGSFQRPTYSKQNNKGRNMGFPPLYSAQFRLK